MCCPVSLWRLPALSACSARLVLFKKMVCCCFLLNLNLSLPVGGEVISNKAKPTMLELQENLSLLQLIGCIFIQWDISFCSPSSPTTPLTTLIPTPRLHLHLYLYTPKPRLFVTVVIGRLNTLQYSPDPHPIGSLQTLRRYKGKQNSWPCPTHVSPWPPHTLYFKCTVTWTWYYTHTHSHTHTHTHWSLYS